VPDRSQAVIAVEPLPPKVAFPSGEQIELCAGDQRVVVVEAGAGLRAYTVAGRDVLDGYADHEMATAGRGQVLMPWPNRLQDGAYEFDGERYQLPLTEPETHNPIHGLVRWVAWSVVQRGEHRVRLAHTLHPQPGYSFSLQLRIDYSLSETGLRVTSTATNVGGRACPYGSGAHPYLTLGTPTVDPIVLRGPGHSVLHFDERGLPLDVEPVDGSEYDVRTPRAIGDTKLDNAYTDLARDPAGLARVELRGPDGATSVSLWLDETYPYLQLFTGDPLPSVNRRSLAVEPMTCAPNGFRTGEGVLVLEPGESTTSTWGIEA
jgi:aldose 1-epimerase